MMGARRLGRRKGLWCAGEVVALMEKHRRLSCAD